MSTCITSRMISFIKSFTALCISGFTFIGFTSCAFQSNHLSISQLTGAWSGLLFQTYVEFDSVILLDKEVFLYKDGFVTQTIESEGNKNGC